MSRTPLIAANWKMHKTVSEAADAAKKLAGLCRNIKNVEVMIAPPFLSIPTVSRVLTEEKSAIALAAQNLHFEDQGAFTGEVSGPMIKDAGASYVLIGHSERRQFFGDTNNWTNQKIQAAIRSGLVPVLCVGETEAQRNDDQTFFILDKQITDGVKGLGSESLKNLVVAYEPVWAIGTGKTANNEQIREVHEFLRFLLEKRFSKELAERIRILYGGSVKPENIKGLMEIEDVDGALVGGASLDPEIFIQIIRFKE